MKPVVCIAGPTASGKSAWAVQIAKSVNGEIINADAMQVYSDLRVISARPDVQEMEDVPHHLFGHVDGAIRYSTGMWLRDAVPVILDIMARGRVPIVTGGTGLYFKALTQGLAAVPDADISDATALLDKDGIKALRATALRLDPIATARVLGDDPQRLIRIVSVARNTAKPLSVWQADTKPIVPRRYWRGAVLLPDRAQLYARINARFDAMVDTGGLDEVRALMLRGLPADLPVMKAIGVQQFKDCLDNADALAASIKIAKRDTRRFAKRQFTWFRGQAADWDTVENVSQRTAFMAKISNFND
ncbi:tRNA (adenosine(37)-N6)-dimethylallyltransferase MiaA [Fretibacter rubidus]|uniref:tRNA (adenosine(37)-N6)-dimethylallyltransferase MiaA n=1 Tax=Fretibacter rubidus TaxID=570162 RepID=UPI00352AB6C9